MRQAQEILKKGERLVQATALAALPRHPGRVHPLDALDDGDQPDVDRAADSAALGPDSEFVRLQRNILVQLKYMLRTATTRTRILFYHSEWALLAMILDRILFYALLILTFIFSFVLSLRFVYRI